MTCICLSAIPFPGANQWEPPVIVSIQNPAALFKLLGFSSLNG